MDNSNGWVKLHRKLFDSELWTGEPFTKGQAWIDLFANANHQDNSFWVRGNEVQIKRGQIGWSELTMAKRWGWSKNKVRRFLKWLETKQQIVQQKTFITSILTILNYDSYQSGDAETEQQAKQQKDSRRYTNKNVKNDKNEKKLLQATEPPEVNELIGYFQKTVNPHISYGNKSERQASVQLLKAYGLDTVKKSLAFLEDRRKTDKFLPTITTPYELWTKWAKIKQHLETKRGEVKGIEI